jgi:Protein of unknown function (DUF3349)
MASLVPNFVTWLRAGYPEGVPEHDYVPLFALLGSQLTDEQIAGIAEELASSGELSSAQAIRAAIKAFTRMQPLGVDIERVRLRLADGGWPLGTPLAEGDGPSSSSTGRDRARATPSAARRRSGTR